MRVKTIVLSSLVLILVLMEYGLRGQSYPIKETERGVLILVLMEYGLRAMKFILIVPINNGLNPCFDGIWSASRKQQYSEEAFWS